MNELLRTVIREEDVREWKRLRDQAEREMAERRPPPR